jgi:hypothetical protein
MTCSERLVVLRLARFAAAQDEEAFWLSTRPMMASAGA